MMGFLIYFTILAVIIGAIVWAANDGGGDDDWPDMGGCT